MARIPDDVIELVRRSVDVAEVVGRYTPLRKQGKSFKGRCPFHQEKTPSFHVFPESGIWKCFGCGVGGNVFTFLMQKEGLRFFEAVQQLAQEAGVALPDDDDPQAAARAAHFDRLRKVNEWACRHFQAALRDPEGQRARDYFKRRGILGTTARDFRLGYAPPGWDRMLVAARRDGIPETDLLEAGLVIAREGGSGAYDRFRDRVVFPIQDPKGDVIAFGARTLGDDEPKYLNSPETPLYTKGRHLYAFHLAKGEMLRAGEGAVMEGYTDVILAHQAGFRVAVAGLGTALTAEQARKLAQYAKKLYLVYDGDAAGLRAAEKAIPSFLPEPIETRVCVLPGEKDPADVFVSDGADAFRACLAQSREAFDHLLAVRAAAHDMESVPGRTAAVEECLEALVNVADEIRRALYVKRLSEELGVPEDVASRKLSELRSRAASHGRDRRPPPGAPHGPSRAGPSGASGGPPRGPAQRAAPEVQPVPDYDPDADHEPAPQVSFEDAVPAASAPEPPQGPPPAAERLLLEALLGAPELAAEVPGWLPATLWHRGCRRLAEGLLAFRPGRDGGPPDVSAWVATVDDPALAALAADLLAAGAGKRLLEQGRDCLARLRAQHEERTLGEELRGTDSEAEEGELLRRIQELHRRRAGK